MKRDRSRQEYHEGPELLLEQVLDLKLYLVSYKRLIFRFPLAWPAPWVTGRAHEATAHGVAPQCSSWQAGRGSQYRTGFFERLRNSAQAPAADQSNCQLGDLEASL